MTNQAHSSPRTDLVGLYAGRLRARGRQPISRREHRRASGGVQTFGRRPAIRQLTTSRRRRTVTALMATAVLAGSTPALTSASTETHEVQPGETLSAIAERTGVSVEDLARINKIEDPNLIFPGDTLLLDGDLDVAVGDTVYRIKQGDTLSGIANAHGVDLDALLALNEIANPDLIIPGDSVIIPTREQYETVENVDLEEADSQNSDAPEQESSTRPRSGEYEIATLHLVARGETLSSIAQRYEVPMDLLVAANGIEDPDLIQSGDLLNIPVVPDASAEQATAELEQESGGTVLQGVPALSQSLSLSCESAALSIATAYWGNQVSEWVFIENMPYDANPHHGFRGDMSGPFGWTDDYGVYAKPLAQMLANYGFVGEEFYTQGDPEPLKDRIDQGQPVLVWMTSGATDQERFYEEHNGERFTLVPQQHVVVAYGYDDTGVHVADPGTGQHRIFGWDEFVQSWSKFDGMSLAVYPNS